MSETGPEIQGRDSTHDDSEPGWPSTVGANGVEYVAYIDDGVRLYDVKVEDLEPCLEPYREWLENRGTPEYLTTLDKDTLHRLLWVAELRKEAAQDRIENGRFDEDMSVANQVREAAGVDRVRIQEEIDRRRSDKLLSEGRYWWSAEEPTSPAPGDDSGGAGGFITVDIEGTLGASQQELSDFARELMEGQAADPFRDAFNLYDINVGVRAGDIEPGQKDAFVWAVSPFTESLALTLSNDEKYDSVCIVKGQKREAGNGKLRMHQIIDPVVVLKIEGENLRKLQDTYQKLYHEPDFALTKAQRLERNRLFNDHLADLISHEAAKNKKAKARNAQAAQKLSTPLIERHAEF